MPIHARDGASNHRLARASDSSGKCSQFKRFIINRISQFSTSCHLVIPSAAAGNTAQWLSVDRLSLSHYTLTQYRQGADLPQNLYSYPGKVGRFPRIALGFAAPVGTARRFGGCGFLWLSAAAVAWSGGGGGVWGALPRSLCWGAVGRSSRLYIRRKWANVTRTAKKFQ